MIIEDKYWEALVDSLLYTNNVKRIHNRLAEFPTVFYITKYGINFIEELLKELSLEKNVITLTELAEILAISETDENIKDFYQKLKHVKSLKLNVLANALSENFKKVNLVIKETDYLDFIYKKSGVLFPVLLLCL